MYPLKLTPTAFNIKFNNACGRKFLKCDTIKQKM